MTFSEMYGFHVHVICMMLCIYYTVSVNSGSSQAVMIGDDVLNDVGGAQGCGMAGVLVKTGKYR